MSFQPWTYIKSHRIIQPYLFSGKKTRVLWHKRFYYLKAYKYGKGGMGGPTDWQSWLFRRQIATEMNNHCQQCCIFCCSHATYKKSGKMRIWDVYCVCIFCLCEWVYLGWERVVSRVVWPCPSVRDDIVTPCHLFLLLSLCNAISILAVYNYLSPLLSVKFLTKLISKKQSMWMQWSLSVVTLLFGACTWISTTAGVRRRVIILY